MGTWFGVVERDLAQFGGPEMGPKWPILGSNSLWSIDGSLWSIDGWSRFWDPGSQISRSRDPEGPDSEISGLRSPDHEIRGRDPVVGIRDPVDTLIDNTRIGRAHGVRYSGAQGRQYCVWL